MISSNCKDKYLTKLKIIGPTSDKNNLVEPNSTL